MKQESEIRNGIVVSAWESRVSKASVLETNCVLHIIHGRRDRFHLSDALHNYVGIFQPMSGYGANNSIFLRKLFERVRLVCIAPLQEAGNGRRTRRFDKNSFMPCQPCLGS